MKSLCLFSILCGCKINTVTVVFSIFYYALLSLIFLEKHFVGFGVDIL